MYTSILENLANRYSYQTLSASSTTIVDTSVIIVYLSSISVLFSQQLRIYVIAKLARLQSKYGVQLLLASSDLYRTKVIIQQTIQSLRLYQIQVVGKSSCQATITTFISCFRPLSSRSTLSCMSITYLGAQLLRISYYCQRHPQGYTTSSYAVLYILRTACQRYD